MDVTVDDERSPLARSALARSRTAGREVVAFRLDDGPPAHYVADEIVVDARDRELVEHFLDAGGEVTRGVAVPELPDEFRRLGLGREEPVDMTGLPQSVTIRFRELPDAQADLGRVLGRTDVAAERVRFSSSRAVALAALVAPARAEGRGVWLNEIGKDAVLTHRQPTEAGGSDPLTWATMSGPFRIAQAWQLVESMRAVRTVQPVVWICVCDSGFWWEANTTPGAAAAAAFADLGVGAPLWNLVTDSAGVPSGPGRTNYHGQSVASAAAAALGNALGSAGSGGTVARAAYFFDDRTADTAKRAMVRCTQWGIPFVVYSGQFTSVEFFFGTSAWNDTFNWAADNGTIMFAAAGNDNRNLPDDAVQRPATRTPRTLTVGATDAAGAKASFSSWGASVNVWAPGVSVPVGPTPSMPGGGNLDGTSFATPLVAGVAAMVRAVNPGLGVDQVRDLLVATAWPGGGAVSRGLDAYAAVWAAMADRFKEETAEAPPERLFPRADGTFAPLFNDAVNRAGDRDEFVLDVPTFSTLTLDLQWYAPLASLQVELANDDPDAIEPVLTTTSAEGRATMSAQLGSGTYRITVRGNAPTAYLLTGRLTAGRLLPDYLEGNDSFLTATKLRFADPTGPLSPWPWFAAHGPGDLDLTLHTAAVPPNTSDQDFFEVDVPTDLNVALIPRITIRSDEPVDVIWFDATQAQQASWLGTRDVNITFVPGDSGYLRVSGAEHTRYRLWVGATVSPVFGREWEEVHIFPKWWEHDVHPEWLTEPEEWFGVIVDEPALSDGLLGFATVGSATLGDDVRLELLDTAGSPVREGSVVDGTPQFDLTGLDPGAYIVHIQSAANPANPIALTSVPPPGLR